MLIDMKCKKVLLQKTSPTLYRMLRPKRVLRTSDLLVRTQLEPCELVSMHLREFSQSGGGGGRKAGCRDLAPRPITHRPPSFA